MRRILLLLVGIAVLWVPAVSVAGDSSPSLSKPAATTDARNTGRNVSNAAIICRNRRSEANFAFGKCVSKIAKHEGKSDNEVGGPKSNGQDGDEGEGTDNAHSQDQNNQGRDDSESDGQDKAKSHGGDSASPAMTCKAMEANDLAHFRSAYGVRPNAFGKCVASHANGYPPSGGPPPRRSARVRLYCSNARTTSGSLCTVPSGVV
jgi:hypothetical protein